MSDTKRFPIIVCFYNHGDIDERISAWLVRRAVGVNNIEFRDTAGGDPDLSMIDALRDRVVVWLTKYPFPPRMARTMLLRVRSLLVIMAGRMPRIDGLEPAESWRHWSEGLMTGTFQIGGLVSYHRSTPDTVPVSLAELTWRYFFESGDALLASSHVRFPIGEMLTMPQGLTDICLYQIPKERVPYVCELRDARDFATWDKVLPKMIDRGQQQDSVLSPALYRLDAGDLQIPGTSAIMTPIRRIKISEIEQMPCLVFPYDIGARLVSTVYAWYGPDPVCIITRGMSDPEKQAVIVLSPHPIAERRGVEMYRRELRDTDGLFICYDTGFITPNGWLGDR